MSGVAVVVSGAPGSGKTTCARALADFMRLPHLNKDLFMHSLRWGGMERDLANGTAFRLIYGTASTLLAEGMSLVVDMTLYPRYSVGEIARLRAGGAVVNVHCWADDALVRFERRMLADDRNNPTSVAMLVQKTRAQWADVSRPLELGVPRVEVDCSEGYDPALEVVAAWIEGCRGDHDRGRPRDV